MNHAMNSMNCNARIFGVTERMIEGGDLPPNLYIDTLSLHIRYMGSMRSPHR